MRHLLIASVSLMILSGCKTLDLNLNLKPQATEVVTNIPAAQESGWVEQAPEDFPTTDWVSSFYDSQLSALVSEALSANTDVTSAEASYRASLARINISEADLLPSVTGSVDASRREFGNSLIPGATGLGYGVNASWEADLWGRVRDGIEATELSAEASNADYAGVRLAIAGQVAQNWFNLIEARLQTELAERDVETQARALRLTTRRFEGGVTGSSDVRLARSSVARSEATLAQRRQNLSAIARSLEVLLRRYPADEIQSARDLPELPVLTGAGDQAYLLRKRPDLLAAERRMLAAGLEVDIARKNLLPRLSLNGGVNSSGSGLNNIFDIDSLIANIAAGLTQPLFQGGRLKANVEQQKYLLKQLLERYAGTALSAYAEVENALDAETRLSEREAALRTSVEEAKKAEERLEIRYSEGLATILQLLDAQSRRISAESQLISARKERLANRVRLHVALGGGLETQGVMRLASRG